MSYYINCQKQHENICSLFFQVKYSISFSLYLLAYLDNKLFSKTLIKKLSETNWQEKKNDFVVIEYQVTALFSISFPFHHLILLLVLIVRKQTSETHFRHKHWLTLRLVYICRNIKKKRRPWAKNRARRFFSRLHSTLTEYVESNDNVSDMLLSLPHHCRFDSYGR